MKIWRMAAAAGLAASSIAMADSDWAAAVSGNWSVPGNWNPADVPDSAGETATIDVAPGTYTVTLDAGMSAPTIFGLDIGHSGAQLDVIGGRSLTIDGGLFHNEGLVRLNSNNSASDAFVLFNVSTTLTGSGKITLMRTGADSRIESAPGAVVTVGADQKIDGRGEINAALVNLGVIESDVAGGVLSLRVNDKVNSGTMTARSTGTLSISGIAVDNTLGSILGAESGVVRFPPDSPEVQVTGGVVSMQDAARVEVLGSSAPTFDAVTISGAFDVLGGGQLHVRNGLTQSTGTLTVNSNASSSDAILRFVNSGALDGAGTVRLARSGGDSQLVADAGITVTHASGHTISGRGTIAAAMINDGLIRSDIGGASLILTTYDITNNADIEASGGGQVDLKSITINQAGGGRLLADGGTLRVPAGPAATIGGGEIETLNSGLLQVDSSASLSLDGVTLNGNANIQGGGTVSVTGGMALNGTIVVNANSSSSDAILHIADTSAITGVGTILMSRSSSDSQFTTEPGETVTIGADTAVEGRGQVHAALINDGTIESDVGGSRLELTTNDKTNNSIIRATGGGIIEIDGITLVNAPSGVIHAGDNSIVDFPVGMHAVNGGTISSAGTGSARVSSSGVLTLDQVTISGSLDIFGSGTLVVGTAGVTNDGVIVVNSNASASDARVQLSDGSTLAGSGQIILTRLPTDSQIMTSPGESGTLAGDMRITGQGQIVGDVSIACILEPGMTAPATISHAGTITFDPAGWYRVRIASTSSHGRFSGSADVTIGGTLNPVFEGGYTPVKNHFFTIITAGSVAGDFDAIDAPALPDGLVYRLVKTATSVDLRIVCAPDLNADGSLDFFDVQTFLQAFSAQSDPGDYNEDDVFNFFDVQAFLNAFSIGCP